MTVVLTIPRIDFCEFMQFVLCGVSFYQDVQHLEF